MRLGGLLKALRAEAASQSPRRQLQPGMCPSAHSPSVQVYTTRNLYCTASRHPLLLHIIAQACYNGQGKVAQAEALGHAHIWRYIAKAWAWGVGFGGWIGNMRSRGVCHNRNNEKGSIGIKGVP